MNVCPYCCRPTSSKDGRWSGHLLPDAEKSSGAIASIGDRYCPMSDQYMVVEGHDSSHYRRRALQVCDLAAQLQHSGDPRIVWDVLTTVPADELQRLAVIALAGINTDQAVEDVFGWVLELPAARWAS